MLDYTSKTYSFLNICAAADFVPHRSISPLPLKEVRNGITIEPKHNSACAIDESACIQDLLGR